MDEVKCLDTYALVEIKLGNPKFKNYLGSNCIILDLILAEFYTVILREESEEVADFWFKKLENYSVPVSKEILIEAVKFRHKHRKQNISFFDAVGYIFSVKTGCHFVTGDKEFKGLPNVDFKKKD